MVPLEKYRSPVPADTEPVLSGSSRMMGACVVVGVVGSRGEANDGGDVVTGVRSEGKGEKI